MKKIIYVGLLLFVFVLTGCEKNRLVCTYEEEEIKNLKSETKYVFSFNEENVKNVTMTTKVTLSGDYDSDAFITSYKEMATAAAEEYNATNGVSSSVTSKKNVVTLKVEMVASSMSDEDKETYGLDLTKKELKETLEEIGYTCE